MAAAPVRGRQFSALSSCAGFPRAAQKALSTSPTSGRRSVRFRCVSAVLALLRSDRRIASDQSGYRFGSVAGGGGWSRLQSIKPFSPLGFDMPRCVLAGSVCRQQWAWAGTAPFAAAVRLIFSCALGALLSVEYADLMRDYGMLCLIFAETCLSMNDVSQRRLNRWKCVRLSVSLTKSRTIRRSRTDARLRRRRSRRNSLDSVSVGGASWGFARPPSPPGGR